MTDRKALGFLTLLLLIIALPFVRRAYFVDDFYFVTMAKGILEHPARPYDFISDDAGIGNIAWERGKQPRMVNPPLFHYFLAAVIKLWGDAVWKLRTASLVFPLISLYAAYFLGKRFVKNSFAAASLLAITPAFWLTSYSLLIDSALLAFVLLALNDFISGHEQKSSVRLVRSGLWMGAALLTKYTGFLVVPVVLAWHLLHRKSCSVKGTTMALGVCGVLFLLWGFWGMATYGQMHFTATFSRGFHPATSVGLLSLGLFIIGTFLRWRWPAERRMISAAWVCWGVCVLMAAYALQTTGLLGVWIQTMYIDKVIAVGSFIGGTTVFLFFAPVLLGLKRKSMAVVLAGLAILMFACFISPYGGFDPVQSATLAFFISATLAFLMLLGIYVTPISDPSLIFLGAWVLMGVLEQVVVMPWTAGRYLLILLPPVVWLFQGWIENENVPTFGKLAWVTTFGMGLALACVDYGQAGVIVPLSEALQSQQPMFQEIAPRPKHHWYYLADTFDGSQPYVLKSGWENVFPHQVFESGGLFLRSYYRKSSWWNVSDPERFQPIMAWEYSSWIPLRVMDVPASAGFYASCWGTLPYAITRHPLERFELYLVK